jgi:tRNA pseudouridine13 synthase
MREAHERERTVGIEWYVSDADGIGGQLRTEPGDFRVSEVETLSPDPVDADPGSYPHLLVRARLRSWDTNDFARHLSKRLGASRERISWAGTKDKHAVTTQLFSIRDVTPEEIPEIDDAELTILGRLGRDLSFGDLAGNAFEIRVRETAGDPDAITTDLASWWRGGETDADAPDPDSPAGASMITDESVWVSDLVSADAARTRVAVPNWFGHQRFGSRRPITHEVGLELLSGDWRGAVLAYVGNPFETEPEDSQRAREVVEREAERDDPDWQAALDAMPGRLRFERSMLHRLNDPDPEAIDGGASEKGDGSADDAVGGTEGSADDAVGGADGTEGGVWRYALEAVPENLQRMFVNAAQSYVFNRILSERLERGLPFDRPVTGDVVCFRDADDDRVARPDAGRTQRATEDRVSILTRHCERGRAFVTAPLVGTETELAAGEPGEIEREVLAEVGVEPSDFSLPGAFDSTGTRRAILVATDLAVGRVDGDPVFSFALPSGAYATGLLREFMQCDPARL